MFRFLGRAFVPHPSTATFLENLEIAHLVHFTSIHIYAFLFWNPNFHPSLQAVTRDELKHAPPLPRQNHRYPSVTCSNAQEAPYSDLNPDPDPDSDSYTNPDADSSSNPELSLRKPPHPNTPLSNHPYPFHRNLRSLCQRHNILRATPPFPHYPITNLVQILSHSPNRPTMFRPDRDVTENWELVVELYDKQRKKKLELILRYDMIMTIIWMGVLELKLEVEVLSRSEDLDVDVDVDVELVVLHQHQYRPQLHLTPPAGRRPLASKAISTLTESPPPTSRLLSHNIETKTRTLCRRIRLLSRDREFYRGSPSSLRHAVILSSIALEWQWVRETNQKLTEFSERDALELENNMR
ncbi:uncharacterized protein BDR25DRAFT_360578 [Lindgomyces ingoldianus]|uniref:Uncharacterized protein n=1 Tax=Lindgomyces ingoldianus TaxID=673940 RepID=A0ACB6QFD5_9PLEO|nr:uncharacterized protein BDR25DRAFT_360578 [Lindgomyces ingoldianus]KAF2465646.1 hypothetical protein BDR25DRAFT_360578 [Lindgomyces ingoldianus]